MKRFYQNTLQFFLLVSLLLGIVFSFNFLSSQYHLRWDFTAEKEHTLSQTTHKLLNNLEDNLTIKFYVTKDLPAILLPVKQEVSDLFAEMKSASQQNILIEETNPNLNEETEQEAATLGIPPLELNIKEKDRLEVKKVYFGLVLYYKDKREIVPVAAQTESLEYKLDLAILRMTKKDLPRVGIYIGSNPETYNLLGKIVAETATPVYLSERLEELVQKDLDLLLLIDPVNITKNQTVLFDTLLENKTNLLIFASNTQVSPSLIATPSSTGLDDWLAQKGLGISSELLVDIKQNAQAGFQTGMMQVYMPYPFWVRAQQKDINHNHPITALIEDILFPWTNVLQIYNDKDSDWSLQELVTSSATSFLQPEELPDVSPDYVNTMSALPLLANHPLVVELQNTKHPDFGKIIITPNYYLLQDQFFQQAPSNALFVSNMFEYASWGDELIGIRSRGKTSRPLKELSQKQKTVYKWAHMAGIPSLAVFAGLVFLGFNNKRRKKYIRKFLLKKD